MALEFPAECYLLADKGYANRYPLMSPFGEIAVRRNPGNLILNKTISIYRARIEHVIAVFKTYRCISSRYWRNDRWLLPVASEVCAALANRKINLAQFVRGHDS